MSARMVPFGLCRSGEPADRKMVVQCLQTKGGVGHGRSRGGAAEEDGGGGQSGSEEVRGRARNV